MSSKGKSVKKPGKPEKREDAAEQRLETISLMTIFRQDKLLSIERDAENNIYIRARKRPESLDESAKWDTIQFKLSDQEAALLALKLFSALMRGDENG